MTLETEYPPRWASTSVQQNVIGLHLAPIIRLVPPVTPLFLQTRWYSQKAWREGRHALVSANPLIEKGGLSHGKTIRDTH